MCVSKMIAVAFASMAACSGAMRVRKDASLMDLSQGGGAKTVMPVLQSDFNPIGEGTIPGAYGLMIHIFGTGEGADRSLHVEDLRDICISRRFPAAFDNSQLEVHSQVRSRVPERTRQKWLSGSQMTAQSPHPGKNGFVTARMHNINFIICPFLSTMINEGALPLKQDYSKSELKAAMIAVGLDPKIAVSHADGNFLHDPDEKQDLWNMEGFTNEHVTSTGIHDCITKFNFCHHNHAPDAICATETRRNCRMPNRLLFEQFVDAVDSNGDNLMTFTELSQAAEVAEGRGIPIFPTHEE